MVYNAHMYLETLSMIYIMYPPFAAGCAFQANVNLRSPAHCCIASIRTSAAHSGDCKQQIGLNVLDFILFTYSFA